MIDDTQELRLHGIDSLGAANEYLRDVYIGQSNASFQVPAAERGTAFTGGPRKDLELIFSIQNERVVKRDNTVDLRASRCRSIR
jgi:hypothetical protein